MEWLFSQMKMIRTRLQSRLREINFSCLKIGTESSPYLSNDEHKEIVDI